MDFRYINAFHQVALEKSFNRAAKNLAISPSAVTRQIKLLEESCQRQLILRSTKNVDLTQNGQNLFNAIERFNTELQQHNLMDYRVSLKIGAMEGVLREKILPQIIRLEKEQNWNLHIEVNSPNALTEQLSRGDLDLIFISNANETLIPSHFDIIPYCDEKIILISRHEVSLKELHKHTWICFEQNSWISRYSRKKSEKTIRVNDMESLIKLVKSGVGIAMIPEHCVSDKKGLNCIEVKRYGKQPVSIVTSTNSFRPQIVQAFIDKVVAK